MTIKIKARYPNQSLLMNIRHQSYLRRRVPTLIKSCGIYKGGLSERGGNPHSNESCLRSGYLLLDLLHKNSESIINI